MGFKKLLNGQNGLSLVEILFATFILYIVLTALIGVFAMSSRMVMSGNSEDLAATIANERLEQIRSLPFDKIGIKGSTDPSVPPGVIEPVEEAIRSNIKFIINTSVRWVDDPYEGVGITTSTAHQDYKKIEVLVSWGVPAPGGVVAMASYLAEKPSINFLPEVTFEEGAPATGTIVWGSIDIPVHAVDVDGYISTLRYSVDGRFPAGSSTTSTASDVTYTFTWNSTETVTQTVPLTPDGIRWINAEAWDNRGGQGKVKRVVYLDNFAPDTPKAPDASSLSLLQPDCTSTLNLNWTAVWDGPPPVTILGVTYYYADIHAYGYKIERRRQDDASWTNWEDEGTVTASSYLQDDCPTTFISSGLTPFTRYQYRLVALSPRGLESAESVSVTTVTPLALAGTSSRQGKLMDTTLTWWAPYSDFDDPPGVGYALYRSTLPAEDLSQIGTTLTTITDNQYFPASYTHSEVGIPKGTYYYQVIAGYSNGGVLEEVKSNVVMLSE